MGTNVNIGAPIVDESQLGAVLPDTDAPLSLSQTPRRRLRVDAEHLEQLLGVQIAANEEMRSLRETLLELFTRGPRSQAGSMPVTLATDLSPVQVSASDATAAGLIDSINANTTGGPPTPRSTVMIALNGHACVTFQVTGVYTGALTPQISNNGVNWVTMGFTCLTSLSANGLTATVTSGTTGAFVVNVAGFGFFRLSANAAVTGSAVVTMRASMAKPSDQNNITIGSLPASGMSVSLIQSSSTSLNALANPSTKEALTTANVKSSAGNLFGLVAINNAAAKTWIQLYDTAGTPTLGASVLWSVPILPSGIVVISTGTYAIGTFASGIGAGAATSATGSGVPATAPDVTFFYK
jgi:hypothetical protein